METTVINIKSGLETDFVYIGRNSIFANPFEISRDGDRNEVIEKYKKWFNSLIKDPRFVTELTKLKGRKLGCFCKQPLSEIKCHGDVIKEYLDSLPEQPIQDTFKLAVVGSRKWKDANTIYRILDKNKDKIEMIISGGAEGADSIANDWCRERGCPITIFYPKWRDEQDNFVKGAGFLRNKMIVEAADKVVAFQVDKSRGCQNSIDWAIKLGKVVRVFENEI